MLSRVLFAAVLFGLVLQHSVGKLTKPNKPSYDGEPMFFLSFIPLFLSRNRCYTPVFPEHSLADRLELFFLFSGYFANNII